MGHESLTYGAIELHRSIDDHDRYLREASDVIAQLPVDRDSDEWPFLTQQYFSVGAGYYRSNVLLFGGSCKRVECVWDEWLAKFEDVISKLCWSNCWLHLRTEIALNFDFRYTGEGTYIGEPGKGNWIPPAKWNFTGGPRCNSSNDIWYDESQTDASWIRIDGEWTLDS